VCKVVVIIILLPVLHSDRAIKHQSIIIIVVNSRVMECLKMSKALSTVKLAVH
jgi:hypothetical protein